MSDLALLKKQAAVVAINNMLAGNHFSICVVRDVAGMLEGDITCDEYKVLHTLHCVDYNKMTPEIKKAIPQLIAACMKRPDVFQFPMPSDKTAYVVDIVDVEFTVVSDVGPASEKRKKFLGLPWG
jgi:hypothetical protein